MYIKRNRILYQKDENIKLVSHTFSADDSYTDNLISKHAYLL